MLTTGIKSLPLGSLPNTSRMSSSAHTQGRGKEKESLSSGATSPGSEQKCLPKIRSVSSLSGGRFSTGLVRGHRVAGSPSCVTATSLRCHIPPYTWSQLLTHTPSQRIWTSMNKAAKLTMLHYSMGLRSLSLCPKNKWEKRICSACPDMDCIRLPDWDWHWLSRVEVIWHQKGSEEPKAARSYEAHLLSYQCLKKSAQKWITIPSRHPSPCVTCSGWQTTLLQHWIPESVLCISPLFTNHYL